MSITVKCAPNLHCHKTFWWLPRELQTRAVVQILEDEACVSGVHIAVRAIERGCSGP